MVVVLTLVVMAGYFGLWDWLLSLVFETPWAG